MKELVNIQSELKAPKGQFNKFGGYKYRSAEDILEAVKPLLRENNCTLTISDDIVQVGDRYYIKANVTLTNSAGTNVSVSALAREEEQKKGMDSSQITGTASSYARKYALNGLFCIDDTKDADTEENIKEQQGSTATAKKSEAQATSQPKHSDNRQLDLDLALTEMREANSLVELQSVWTRWKAFQNINQFINLKNQRKNELISK